jgi:cyanophycinase
MYPLVLAAVLCGQNPMPHPGHLVIVGGGAVPAEVFAKSLALAGGQEARVLVIPQASTLAGFQGHRAVEMFRAAGAREVAVLDPQDRLGASRSVKEADLIWMPGGDQDRLMHVLTTLDLAGAIRERFREGAVVGGTSAGAAVMSQIMLHGIPGHQVVDAREEAGLGLWPDVIVDQHFLRRHRYPRLLNAVLHHPDKPGIGIDEGTAVVVEGRHFEVLGVSKVEVVDARRASPAPPARQDDPAAANVATYLLDAGMKFDLDTGLDSRWKAQVRAASPELAVSSQVRATRKGTL